MAVAPALRPPVAPVAERYFADPFVFRTDDGWRAVGTGPTDDGRVAPMMASDDGLRWTPLGGGLVPEDGHGTDHWAPEIARFGDVWRMFYSVGWGDRGHTLRVAESRRPEGPYRPLPDPVLDPATCAFAIDAHVHRDAAGREWLFYARDLIAGDRPGTVLVVSPLEDGRRVGPHHRVVARATADWQRYQADRPMYDGGVHDWHTLEGPASVVRDGRTYLLYSGGNWTNDTYGVDFVSTDDVGSGAWEADPVDAPRVLRTRPGLLGPGHNSLYVGPDGRDWIAFHAWNEARTARRMHVAPLDWTPDGPRVRF